MKPYKDMAPGLHLIVKTASETVDLSDVKLEPGDRIEFRGSRVTIDGKPAVIAAEIRKGDSKLVLRDAAGTPAWAGWRR